MPDAGGIMHVFIKNQGIEAMNNRHRDIYYPRTPDNYKNIRLLEILYCYPYYYYENKTHVFR